MKQVTSAVGSTLILATFMACERPNETASPDTPASKMGTEPPAQAESDPSAHKREVAVLAGGCFWGMEQIVREIPGVLATDVGYAGGARETGTYEQVKTGETQHAEALRVVFDPNRLSYRELIQDWFFRMHDPTTQNRQGNDVGTQYRSAIFFKSDEQKKTALHAIKNINARGLWPRPVVTEVTQFSTFIPAEDYHQDYLVKNPRGYTCHYLRDPID